MRRKKRLGVAEKKNRRRDLRLSGSKTVHCLPREIRRPGLSTGHTHLRKSCKTDLFTQKARIDGVLAIASITRTNRSSAGSATSAYPTMVKIETTARDTSLGRAWRETREMGTNRAWMIRSLLEGHYENPVRIVAFYTAEGWSRDVTTDIADELRRSYVEYGEVPASVLSSYFTCGATSPSRRLRRCKLALSLYRRVARCSPRDY